MKSNKFLYLAILFLFLNCCLLYTEENSNYIVDKIKFQKQIILPEGITESKDIKTQIYEDKLYFIKITTININNKIFDELYLYRYNLYTDILDSFNISLKYKYINNFCINDKYLVINNDKYFTVFYIIEKQNDLIIENKCSFDMEMTFSRGTIKFIGNKLIAYGCDLSSSRLDQKTQTSLIMLDIEGEKIIKEYFFENPEGIPMMWFQPRIVITANKDYIVISDIINYKLRLYNYNFDLINTFLLDSNFQENIFDKDYKARLASVDIQRHQPTGEMEKIINLNGDISLIHRVEFINDSTLLILRSKPKGDFFKFTSYYDVLMVKDNNIVKLYKDLIWLDREKLIYPKKVNIWNMYNISDNYVVFLIDIPFLLDKEYDSKELKELSDEYYKNNEEIRASLFIYSFDF